MRLRKLVPTYYAQLWHEEKSEYSSSHKVSVEFSVFDIHKGSSGHSHKFFHCENFKLNNYGLLSIHKIRNGIPMKVTNPVHFSK